LESLSYWLALGSAVLILVSVYLLLRSNRGLALTAIRDNEQAASSQGINIPPEHGDLSDNALIYSAFHSAIS